MPIENLSKVGVVEQIKADRAKEEAAHFEGIDLDDLIDEDLAAYEKYVLPMKQFEGLSAKDIRQKLSEFPSLRDELAGLAADFRRAKKMLTDGISKSDDKKSAKSRDEFWAFISNKMAPATIAEYLKSKEIK